MKKIKLDESRCIGCGACVQIAPDYFEFSDDGLSKVKSSEVKEGDNSPVDAAESCPGAAIIITDCNCKDDCKCGCQNGEECKCDGNCEK